MAAHEWNPLHRLLALPNESRGKALAVTFLVSVVAAAIVSATTVLMRPIQAANRAAERAASIQLLLSELPGAGGQVPEGDRSMSTVVIDLENGRAAKDVSPATLQAALDAPLNWTALSEADDIAGLGKRPNFVQVMLLRDSRGIALFLLPISGQGYGGRIHAILAVTRNLSIAGLTVTEHSETPGLGGRISERGWQEGFAGVAPFDANGRLAFLVARGPASGSHEVDGITGATRTGRGVTQMVRFWLGPSGYGPFLAAFQRGEF
ncbi:FMN-binding protein [Roseivivax sp. CAU 1761]